MAVSQSNTMWVKKGTVVNGKKVKKGYVAQKGKPEKRVTNKIKLVVDTDKRGKAGETVQAKKGRYVKSTKKIKVDKPKSKGGGYTGNGKPTSNPGKTDRPKTDTPTPDTPAANTPKGKPQLGGKGKGLEGLSAIEKTSYNLTSSNTRAPNKAKKSDRKATSATVSAAKKTEKPRAVTSVKGYVDNVKSARRKVRADVQNNVRPIKLSAKNIKTKAQAKAVLASKTASASLKAAARRVIEGY